MYGQAGFACANPYGIGSVLHQPFMVFYGQLLLSNHRDEGQIPYNFFGQIQFLPDLFAKLQDISPPFCERYASFILMHKRDLTYPKATSKGKLCKPNFLYFIYLVYLTLTSFLQYCTIPIRNRRIDVSGKGGE